MTMLCLNGTLLPSDKAFISPQDRGFRFGDGVFETIPVHKGVPYLWQYHMERLGEGLQCLGIAYPLETLHMDALRLLETTQTEDACLRIAISRGVGSRGYLPTGDVPTVIIEIIHPPAPTHQPIEMLLSSYQKISPKALPTHCKLAQGLNSTLARMEAQNAGYGEALQCDAAGNIAEATAANIFWLQGDTLYTPSLASGALAGVTRRWLIEYSAAPVQEGLYPLATLARAEAVILTNATMGITPVRTLHPHGWSWESEALAERLNAQRDEHILRTCLTPSVPL